MFKFVPETEEELKIRKYRTGLKTCGAGMFLFGIWEVLKETMVYFAGRQSGWIIANTLRETGASRGLFLVVFYLILLASLVLHFVLGKMALRVSGGKKQSTGYTVFTTVCAVLAVLLEIGMLCSWKTFAQMLDGSVDLIIAYGVDITFVVNTVQIAVLSSKIRKLEESGVK